MIPWYDDYIGNETKVGIMATALEVIDILCAAGAEPYTAILAVRDEESNETSNVIACGDVAYQYAGSQQWDEVKVVSVRRM